MLLSNVDHRVFAEPGRPIANFGRRDQAEGNELNGTAT